MEKFYTRWKPKLLNTIKKRKYQYFGHIIRGNEVQRLLMEGRINGKRGRGRPRTMRTDNTSHRILTWYNRLPEGRWATRENIGASGSTGFNISAGWVCASPAGKPSVIHAEWFAWLVFFRSRRRTRPSWKMYSTTGRRLIRNLKSMPTVVFTEQLKLQKETASYHKGSAWCTNRSGAAKEMDATDSTEGLALWGHDELEGNLVQLLQIRAEDYPLLEQWVTNRKYLFSGIVNEQIDLMGQALLRQLLVGIYGAMWYAVMADETRDISSHAQVTVCIRCEGFMKTLSVLSRFQMLWRKPSHQYWRMSSYGATCPSLYAVARPTMGLQICRGESLE